MRLNHIGCFDLAMQRIPRSTPKDFNFEFSKKQPRFGAMLGVPNVYQPMAKSQVRLGTATFLPLKDCFFLIILFVRCKF